jgi:uncharacterized protein (TIGR02118 family)
MHCVSLMYRKTETSTFDINYYANVHIPLAFALLQQHFGVTPLKGELFGEGFRMGTSDSATYHCIFNMYFRTREDAERLLELRNLQGQKAPSERTVDIRKFSSSDPEAYISEVTSLDTESTLIKGYAIAQKAQGGLK